MPPRYALDWPNLVSIGRAMLVVPFMVCLLSPEAALRPSPRYVAIALFAVMAVSDWFDGYLARRMRRDSLLGRFLDPLADKLLIFCAVLALATIGLPDAGGGVEPRYRLPPWMASAVVGKDLIVLGGFLAGRRLIGRFVIQPRPLGKACTFAVLSLILALLIWPGLPGARPAMVSIMTIAVTALAVAAAADYVRLGLRLVADARSAERTPT